MENHNHSQIIITNNCVEAKENNESRCSVCETPSIKFCSSCKKVYYCSPQHQKSDWKKHKKNCFPAKLHCDEVQGRHFVATKNISKGERIFSEKALVVGPSGAEKYLHKICLGCYRVVRTGYICSKCSWPVCSVHCEKLPPHSDSECEIFSAKKITPYFTKPYEYDLIKFLRTLLLREKDGRKWEELLQLASHKEARAKCEASILATMTSYEFIRDTCQLPQYDYDTVSHVVGVWGVNSFGANAPSGPNPTGRLASFLFPKTSLCSHSCVANTRGILLEEEEQVKFELTNGNGSLPFQETQTSAQNHCHNQSNGHSNGKQNRSKKSKKLNSNSSLNSASHVNSPLLSKSLENGIKTCEVTKPVYTMELFASLPIAENEPILITYAEVGEGTFERQKILRENYYFSCTCTRCEDPTEFNTFFSGIKCPDCQTGYLLPENPLNFCTDWKCFLDFNNNGFNCNGNVTSLSNANGCKRKGIKFTDIYYPLMKIKQELNSIGINDTEREIEKMESILSENSGKVLHRNHWLLMEVRFRLIQRLICYMPQASNINSVIQRCIAYSQHCLQVANIIRPGYNPYRGKILYCLSQAKLQEIVRNSSDDALDKRTSLVKLKGAVLESQEILSKEPIGSDEKVIADSLDEDLKQIQRIISVFNIKLKNAV